MRIHPVIVSAALAVIFPLAVSSAETPIIQGFSVSNGVKSFSITPGAAVEQYIIRSGTDLNAMTPDASGSLNGFTWRVTNSAPLQFFSVGAMPLSSNALLSANVLHRIAFGPTPDDLERLAAIGPQAYIDEQLAPENIEEDLGAWTIHLTNGVPAPTTPQWQYVSVVGRLAVNTASNLYVYMSGAGDVYLDDISLVTLDGSGNPSANLLVNGDFESGVVTPWVKSSMVSASDVSTAQARSGSRSLRLVSSGAGTGQTTSLWQGFYTPALTNANRTAAMLSFWYLPNSDSSKLVLRLSGSGVIANGAPPAPAPGWIYAKSTGFGNTTGGPLYIYLSGAGECYIDDLKLVRGTVAENGPNLIQNGDFESPLSGSWQVTADFTNSFVSSEVSHAGNGSLKIVATAAGGGSGDSIYQSVPGVTNNGVYTVSFWYLPPSNSRVLTVRLSGSRLTAVPDQTIGGIQRRLETIRGTGFQSGAATVETLGGANLHDLRAWSVMNAVRSKRQLLEVLTHFLENHFVTQHAKSFDYFDRFYNGGNLLDILATDWEYREISKWRTALARPDCTFRDLLKIHLESPAEIVYLDTVDSRGNGNNVANENYAREIMELFCMGVDNGYDQQDITVMSRAWTGWSVELVNPQDIDNPFAAPSTRVGFYPNSGSNAKSNIIGVWTFNFKSANHGTNRAPIWSVWNPDSPATNPAPLGPKFVPARFGPPWAGQPYALSMPARTGTNGIQDGYDVMNAIANLPFTMEYISIKLCRLFVHDNFPNPTTHEDAPEYAFYDYTRPDLSPEAKLVHACMMAWESSTPKGNMRAVLSAIFASDLFRSHAGSLQKVKTPLEFTVSTIRALRSEEGDGSATANTDGYSISGRSRTASSAPLSRMGAMMLFDRDSPDGYPEAGPPWVSAGTLAERIRFVQTSLMATGDGRKNDGISGGNANVTDPVALLKKKLASGNWNDANAVAGYFLGILFPAEGRANLDQYRQLAVEFLNTADNGTTPNLFNSLSHTSTAYGNRVRGMVAMLMTLQRFQEQ